VPPLAYARAARPYALGRRLQRAPRQRRGRVALSSGHPAFNPGVRLTPCRSGLVSTHPSTPTPSLSRVRGRAREIFHPRGSFVSECLEIGFGGKVQALAAWLVPWFPVVPTGSRELFVASERGSVPGSLSIQGEPPREPVRGNHLRARFRRLSSPPHHRRSGIGWRPARARASGRYLGRLGFG
jgi:hypothetical protein